MIDGATAATYAITAADVNRGLSCRVNAAGFTNAHLHRRHRPAAEAFLVPRIEGDPRVGSTLSCTRGDWDDPATPYTVTYAVVPRLHRDRGRHRATYVAQTGDSSINCRVTAADVHHVARRRRSALTTQATGGTPINLILPAISGDRRLGKIAHLQPRQLERPRGTAVPGHVPLAPRHRRDPRRDQPVLHDHDRRHGPEPELPGHGQHADDGDQRGHHGPDRPEVIIAPAITGDPRLRQTMSLRPRQPGTRTRPRRTRSATAGCATAP